MASISFVKLSELEGPKRIDPEYYRPDILNLRGIIQKSRCQVVRLGDIVEKGYRAVYWSTTLIPRQLMSKGDVFFLQAANLNDDFPAIDARGMGGVWHKDWEDYPDGRIKRGELLIEVKGKAEKVVMVPKDFPENTMVSGTLFKLSVSKEATEYVLVYLLTKFGKEFRDKMKTNLLVTFVNKNDLYNIPIALPPRGFRRKIKELYLIAYRAYKESEKLYSEAERILLKEIGFDDFKLMPELTYTSSLESTVANHRIDAEYFQPSYDRIEKKIKGYPNGWRPLSSLVETIKPDFNPINYPEKEFRYVELGDIDPTIGTIIKAIKLKGKEAPSRAKRVLRKSDVVISSVEGSLDKVALVDKEHDGNLASSGFLQLRSREILPEVLLAISKSLVVRSQMVRESTGTILASVLAESLDKVVVPDLPEGTQRKIATLIQTAHSKRKQAKEVLKEAIEKVEKTIEN